MKKSLIISAAILALLAYPFWRVINLDPEGGCKDPQYFPLCMNAWLESVEGGFSWEFRKLSTDQEMMEHFAQNRSGFETIVKKLFYSDGTVRDHFVAKLGIDMAQDFESYPEINSKENNHFSPVWAVFFPVSDTRYVIDTTKDDLFFHLRTKGYVYYRTSPTILDGFQMNLPDAEGKIKRRHRVMESLDGPPWPSDWKKGFCWLRKLEGQWFIALCRDRVG